MKKLFLCLTTFAAVLAAPAATVAKAPIGDLGLDAQVVTNVTGLAEYDPMFSEWTNGAVTLIGPIRLQQRPDLSQKDTVISTNGITVWRWIPDGNGGAWAQRSFDWWDVAKAQDLTAATNALAQAVAGMVPAVDLTPATNYTDHLRELLVDGLVKAGTAGQADRAYEADAADSASRAEMADMAYSAMSADSAQYADSAYTLAATESGGEDYRTADSIFQQLDAAATKSALAAVSNEAQVVYRLFSGSNVVLEVTNYNSIANSPKLRLLQLTESNTYEVVWCETNNIEKALLTATNFAATASSAAFANATNASAPRAWSRTTSGMGAEAPSNTTWLSTPVTVISGGYEYEKHVTSNGAIWLLSSKGSTWDFSPSTNNTSYLNIAASDGTPIFKIEKTDSYLLPVHADAVEVDGGALVVDFDLVSATQPYARVCTDLSVHDWQKEEDGISSSLSTVTWTQTGTGWQCRISNNAGTSSLFAYFEYLQEGGVKIVNGGVTDISGGIMVNGVKYSTIGTATVTDKNGIDRTVLTLGN